MEWKRVLFWRQYNIMFTVEMLLFTDETGVNKDDAMRRYQRYWRGQRAEYRSVFVPGKRHNVIPLMSIFGVVGNKVLRAKRNVDPRGTNTKQFKRFVRQVVVPHLRPYPQAHSVVVMDRASIHFHPDIIELIERRGARVFGLAPYCPWDNPTEYLHAFIKAWLKRQQRWVERVGIFTAVQVAMNMLPPGYAVNTIRHCGYLFFFSVTNRKRKVGTRIFRRVEDADTASCRRVVFKG